ncbi:MAG: hypothetical protein IH624_14235 [Phycisphaerae bacterium]|nr:hypothetical protein [Phycisphaerae bacterium]
MCSLSKEDKDIILDFYFRCGDEETINRGRDLVAASSEAAILYAHLEETLTQLDSIKYEPCPDNLVELTIARLTLAASSGQTQLEKLLELEGQKAGDNAPQQEPVGRVLTSPKWCFRESLLKMSSMAAVLLITAGIAWPTLQNMRQTARRITCTGHLGNLGSGLARYASESDDYIPYAAGMGASQWSRIGEAGSHTSNPFMLLKNQYAGAEDFICPGHANATPLKVRPEDLASLQDFACRNNLSYSFRVLGPMSDKRLSQLRGPILVDMSPVFKSFCTQSQSGPVELDDELLKSLSNNHGRRGQNILSTDGSVQFVRMRLVGNDDIFTIRGVTVYYGNELPVDPGDIFLAP